jgi:hypothetical protein
MKILGVLFPGFTALDLIGPTTAWGLIPNTELQTVARTAGPVKVDMGLDYSHRLGRQGEHAIASAPPGATSAAWRAPCLILRRASNLRVRPARTDHVQEVCGMRLFRITGAHHSSNADTLRNWSGHSWPRLRILRRPMPREPLTFRTGRQL